MMDPKFSARIAPFWIWKNYACEWKKVKCESKASIVWNDLLSKICSAQWFWSKVPIHIFVCGIALLININLLFVYFLLLISFIPLYVFIYLKMNAEMFSHWFPIFFIHILNAVIAIQKSEFVLLTYICMYKGIIFAFFSSIYVCVVCCVYCTHLLRKKWNVLQIVTEKKLFLHNDQHRILYGFFI